MEGHCGEKRAAQLYFFALVEITNERSDRLSSTKNKDITVDAHSPQMGQVPAGTYK